MSEHAWGWLEPLRRWPSKSTTAAGGTAGRRRSHSLLLGIRAAMREHNLYDTEGRTNLPPSSPRPAPARSSPAPSTGRTTTWSSPAMGMAGTRFGRNVPLRFTEPERGDRLMTPNPRLVSTRCWPAGRR